MSTVVSEADIQTFERDGVACLRGVLDESWVERMRAALERLLKNPTQWSSKAGDEGHVGVLDSYMYLYDSDFRDLALASPLGELAARCMRSRRAILLWDFFLIKEPRSGPKTYWHQDYGFNWMDGWQNVSTWIPLDIVTIESGAVEYVRGSHRWGLRSEALVPGKSLRDISEQSDGGVELPNIEDDRASYDIIHFDTKPGDCVIHHWLTIHGAPENSSERRRRALCHRIAGDDSVYKERRNPFAFRPAINPHLSEGEHVPEDHDVFPTMWPSRPKYSLRRLTPATKAS
jgi:ectoine hydroxylase-related dioxygenase (phytanoyl-CoA dioxygenase family)